MGTSSELETELESIFVIFWQKKWVYNGDELKDDRIIWQRKFQEITVSKELYDYWSLLARFIVKIMTKERFFL